MKTLAIGSECSNDAADFHDLGIPYKITGLLRTNDVRTVVPLPSLPPKQTPSDHHPFAEMPDALLTRPLRRIAVDSASLVETYLARRSTRRRLPN